MESIKKIPVCLSFIVVGLLIGTGLHAQDQKQDTIYLKDGSIIHGDIVEMIPDTAVLIQTEEGEFFAYEFNEIERIEKAEKIHKYPTRSMGNISFFLGKKFLDRKDWEPFDKHDEWGILLDLKFEETWPIFIAVDLLHSEDEAKTTELNIGVRKVWDNSMQVHPFIGGGLALIKAEIEGTALDTPLPKDKIGGGIWIGGGVYWTLSQHLNLGLNLRWSKAKLSRAFQQIDVGGKHAGLTLGYHW